MSAKPRLPVTQRCSGHRSAVGKTLGAALGGPLGQDIGE